jgi:hypothetical protein
MGRCVVSAGVAALVIALSAGLHGGCLLATQGLERSDSAGSTGSGGSGTASATSSSAESSTSSSSAGAGGAGGAGTGDSSSSSASSASASTSSSGGGMGGGPTFCGDADQLIACYAFDGDLVDGSPNNASLDVQGSPSFVAGMTGQALQLGGAQVTVSNGPTWNNNPITVELWLKPNSVPASDGRMAIVDAGGGFSVFLYGPSANNGPSVIRCNAGFTVFGSTSLTVGAWTHIACVFETDPGDPAMTRIRLHVNGVVDTMTSFLGAFVPATTDVFIGSNDPDGLFPFDGGIDGLRAFNVARTSAEICEAAGGNGC